MNILIIKLSAIGDVVQTLPAVEAIKKTFPASRVTWVVEEAAAGILEGHPDIDRLLVSRRKAWLRLLKSPRTFIEGFGKIRRFIRDLRGIRYDIAVDFQGLLKSGIVIGLARADRKIGFDKTRELSCWFLNERLTPYDREKHALERYLDVARYLGAANVSTGCSLAIESERETMRRRLAEQGLSAKPVVIINPVARWKTKLWPERRFAELADRIIVEKGASVIFTGSREDRPVVARIIEMMREKAENWAGDTTLKEAAALASLADLFITTDTGPMHLAAAAGAKVLALFGPTAPWRTGPYGQAHDVVRAAIFCSPCFKRKCTDNTRCMDAITVEEVLKKAVR
jgi:3-deoxy-D-manno-octulosonic-acid transferase/heptosyltransferase-1